MRLILLYMLVVASSSSALFAQQLAVRQYFREQNFATNFSSFVSFDAAVDMSAITGVGAEQAVVTAHFVNLWSQQPDSIIRPDALGLVGGQGSFPGFDNSDPFLETPGNIRAEFSDGVFSGFYVIDDPRTIGTDFLHLENAYGFAGLFTVGFDNAFYGVDILNVSEFVLHSTELSSCEADLAEPFGVLNFFDVAAYIGLYNAGDPSADLAAPLGSLNFFDVAAFIESYNAGCP